jgi:hypothetical protein
LRKDLVYAQEIATLISFTSHYFTSGCRSHPLDLFFLHTLICLSISSVDALRFQSPLASCCLSGVSWSLYTSIMTRGCTRWSLLFGNGQDSHGFLFTQWPQALLCLPLTFFLDMLIRSALLERFAFSLLTIKVSPCSLYTISICFS